MKFNGGQLLGGRKQIKNEIRIIKKKEEKIKKHEKKH